MNKTEIDALVLHHLVVDAMDDYVKTCERKQAAEQAAAEAEQVVADMIPRRAELARSAARGTVVTAKESAAVERAIRDAEAHANYCRAVVVEMEVVRKEKEQVHVDASAKAYWPVYDKGVALRIAAAARIDAATAELQAARGEYEAGNALLRAATGPAAHPQGLLYDETFWLPKGVAAEISTWSMPHYAERLAAIVAAAKADAEAAEAAELERGAIESAAA